MTGKPCDWKFDQCPLPMANPSTTKLDMAANLFYLEASHRGLLSIVAVISAMYPVSTVYAGPILYPLEKAGEVMRLFRDYMATAPREMSAFFAPLGQKSAHGPASSRGKWVGEVRGRGDSCTGTILLDFSRNAPGSPSLQACRPQISPELNMVRPPLWRLAQPPSRIDIPASSRRTCAGIRSCSPRSY